MARVTIEDCTRVVPNRFHLVQMAAIRTKQLKKGAKALVKSEENKEVVVSLREIAAGYIRPDYTDEGEKELGLAVSGLLPPGQKERRSVAPRTGRFSRAR